MPFGSTDPDPDSDVIALLSIKTYRLACIQCRLSERERTETETEDAMLHHFDAHRAAGHRIPDSFYEALVEERDHGIDDQIRTVYAWSGREEDGHLSVSLKTPGDSLCCLSCILNEKQMVECFTTDQMLEHLDEHRTWGLFVGGHVYDGLERDRSDNDQVIQRYFDDHGLQRPAFPRWEPHSIFPEFTQSSTRFEALGQLSAMLVIAIRRCVEPLTDSELSAGWTQGCSDAVVEGLRVVLRKIESAHRDEDVDFRLMRDLERIARRPIDEGVRTHFDQRASALSRIRAFISMQLIGHQRLHEWLDAAAEKGRATRGEFESGAKWIGVENWEDLGDV